MSVAARYRPPRFSPVLLFASDSETMFRYVKNVATHRAPSSNVTTTSELSSSGVPWPGARCSASIQIEYRSAEGIPGDYFPLKGGEVLVRPPRFELGTPGLEGRCSIQLSYGRTRNS